MGAFHFPQTQQTNRQPPLLLLQAGHVWRHHVRGEHGQHLPVVYSRVARRLRGSAPNVWQVLRDEPFSGADSGKKPTLRHRPLSTSSDGCG